MKPPFVYRYTNTRGRALEGLLVLGFLRLYGWPPIRKHRPLKTSERSLALQ